MASATLLQLVDVTKAFGGVVAVDSVSASVERGEIRALIGPNGSGKTTLLNLISGFERPETGTIVLSGERIDGWTPHAIAALGVARTFQVPKVFRTMTVLENLLVAGFADHGESALAAIRGRAEDVLRLVRLGPYRYTPAGSLSGGQTVLLQLGRGLMHDPLRLFLLDEPLAGVHPVLKDQIVEVIRRMNVERGVTVLLVSHEMPTVRMLCQRVSVMHDGHWIAEGTLDEVARNAAVVEAYLGRSRGA